MSKWKRFRKWWAKWRRKRNCSLLMSTLRLAKARTELNRIEGSITKYKAIADIKEIDSYLDCCQVYIDKCEDLDNLSEDELWLIENAMCKLRRFIVCDLSDKEAVYLLDGLLRKLHKDSKEVLYHIKKRQDESNNHTGS